ncbi:MAG: tetratricopeptide repeat protein [Actinomycetota bacterium]|nr:tetratricopeptide repeat protein [Actinomycetota bacterium]
MIGPDKAPSKRFLTVLAFIAIGLPLFDHVIALLSTRTSVENSTSGRQAQSLLINLLGEEAKADADIRLAENVAAEAASVRRRRIAAESRALFESNPQAKLDYQEEADHWRRVEEALKPLSPLLLDPTTNRERDPVSQEPFESGRLSAAEMTRLEQEAKGETSGAWDRKSDAYTRIGLMLMVASSLVSLSVIFSPRATHGLLIPAVILLLASIAMTIGLAASRTPQTPLAAIQSVVEGDRLLAQGEFNDAIERYDTALGLRRDYATAYRQRAKAYILRGTPDPSLTHLGTTPDIENLRSAIADEERATRYGASSAEHFNNLGWHYFMAGEYTKGEKFLRKALDANPNLPEARLNLAATLTALAAREGPRADRLSRNADREYTSGIKATLTRPEPEQARIFALARTNLEQVALAERSNPKTEELIRRFQSRLVLEEMNSKLPGKGVSLQVPPSFSWESFQLDGPRVEANGRYENIPEGTRVAFLWYRRAEANPKEWPWVADHAMGEFKAWDLPPSGTIEQPAHAPCPPHGEYRLDVYVEGALVKSQPWPLSESPFGRSVLHQDEVLGVTFCRPPQWIAEEETGEGSVGFTSINKELRFAMRVFSLPQSLRGMGKTAVEEHMITTLGRNDPPHPEQPHFVDHTQGAVTGRRRVYLNPDGQGVSFVFAGLGRDSVMRTVVAQAPKHSFILLYDNIAKTIEFQDRS